MLFKVIKNEVMDRVSFLLKERYVRLKKMEKLMSNPYAWSVLSLCTVFSLIFAIYTWIVGRKTKEISVDYFSNEIIKQGKNPISKLNIEFEGKPIQDLTSTVFYIWNSGSEVINHDDVVEKALKIKCKSESFFGCSSY